MQPAKLNYKIYEGSTFQETFRWESQTKSYAQISAITKSAPCVITTSANHTCPVNWRARVTGVSGMKEINVTSDDEYYLVTSKTNNTVMRKFTHKVLFVLKKVNKVLTELGSAAAFAIRN